MSEVLLNLLQFIRANMKSKMKIHLKDLSILILSKRFIDDQEAIKDPKDWGQGWMPAPFNRMMNRFAIFVYLVYYGRFQMAKEVVVNTNMMYSGYQRSSVAFLELANKIMYEVLYVVTEWARLVVKDFKKKTKKSSEDIFKMVTSKLKL